MVVLENVVRPDTIGQTELVSAKYSLLPRDENFVLDLSAPPSAEASPAAVDEIEAAFTERVQHMATVDNQLQKAMQIIQTLKAKHE